MDMTSPKQVTYVITVHGMGEQRDNSTLTPVASRFVDVIRDINGTANFYPRNTLSLGQATGQYLPGRKDNEPWIAFKDLTIEALLDGNPDISFYGLEAAPHTDADCIRFADIYWQDILRDQWEKVGEDSDTWVSAVVSRSFQNPNHPARLKTLMYTLEETVDIVYYASKIKQKDLNKTAFEQYLGDVQIYTESEGCRDAAIEKFHTKMNNLHSHATEGTKNRYIILAHSLGTVMAFDALIAAERKGMKWLENVEAFITLGSPIDKIITLWDFHYDRHLGSSPVNKDIKIPHYNYCDEQDPVGYYLNSVIKKPAYELFDKKEDIVYNHCVIPGAAHVSYWEDIGLFRHIIKKIIAPVPDLRDAKQWFNKWVYAGIFAGTYFFIPLIISVVNLLTLTWALGSESWQARAVSSLAFVTTAWLSKHLLSLTISWRLSANRGETKPHSTDPEMKKELDKYYLSRGSAFILRACMFIFFLAPPVLFIWNPLGFKLLLTWPHIRPFLITAAGSLILLFFFFRNKRKRQDIIGKVSSNDIATVFTLILSIGLFLYGVFIKKDIQFADEVHIKEAVACLFEALIPGNAVYAQKQITPVAQKTPGVSTKIPPRQVVVIDTVHKRIEVYDTTFHHVNKDIIDTRSVIKNDTVVRNIVKHDTAIIHESLTDRAPIQQEGSESSTPLFYFAGLMNAFICFSYSTIKYFSEKGRIKRMKVANKKNQPKRYE